jgi:cell division protein FtsW (lipid II flippase)
LTALSSSTGGKFFLKQLIYIPISLIVVYFTYNFCSLEFYKRSANLIYWLNIGLLIILKFFGTTQLGSQRWLMIGPVSVQPSELAKICLIIFLAKILSQKEIRTYFDIVKVFAYIALPSLLVLIQPDLGTTLVYVAITFGMLFWGILSDYTGRKSSVMVGVLIFLVGCIGCYFSHSITELMISRFIQAFGGSVGSILAQVICRDSFSGLSLGKMFSLIGS